MPPNRPNIHALPPLSPVVNNHQSNRNVAPGMPSHMYPVNSANVQRSKFCWLLLLPDVHIILVIFSLLHYLSCLQVAIVLRIPVMLLLEIY